MSLCFLSKENIENGFALVDNKFITDFMPSCSQTQLLVYIYGLYLCAQSLSPDNSIDNICDHLSLTSEEVTEAFSALSSLGLITILKDSPLQVRYEKIKEFFPSKKFSKEKYADFNQQYINIFESVAQVNPNNFLVYYDFMEETKISPEVMIMIIKFCVSKKGEKISSNYILTVARDWVSEGARTLGAVEQKIMKMEATTESLQLIAKELGKMLDNSLEEKQLYLKWTSSWGFDLQAILSACKLCKRSTYPVEIAENTTAFG
ncbi:MAG: DnaD domain protein [Clostridia bacterium]